MQPGCSMRAPRCGNPSHGRTPPATRTRAQLPWRPCRSAAGPSFARADVARLLKDLARSLSWAPTRTSAARVQAAAAAARLSRAALAPLAALVCSLLASYSLAGWQPALLSKVQVPHKALSVAGPVPPAPAAACGPSRRRTAASSPPTPRRRPPPPRRPRSPPSSTLLVSALSEAWGRALR